MFSLHRRMTGARVAKTPEPAVTLEGK